MRAARSPMPGSDSPIRSSSSCSASSRSSEPITSRRRRSYLSPSNWLSAAQALPLNAYVLGLPVGALVVNVLLIDDMRDRVHDRAKGWRTGSVRFGIGVDPLRDRRADGVLLRYPVLVLARPGFQPLGAAALAHAAVGGARRARHFHARPVRGFVSDDAESRNAGSRLRRAVGGRDRSLTALTGLRPRLNPRSPAVDALTGWAMSGSAPPRATGCGAPWPNWRRPCPRPWIRTRLPCRPCRDRCARAWRR